MDRFLAALNSLDVDRINSCFADDVTAFVPTVQAGRISGKAAVAEIFRDYVDATKKTVARTNIIPEDTLVNVSGDIAVVTFSVRYPASVARRTFVFRRDGGAWRISHFHASNLQIPAH
jgi:ketosteroid isomerase-like protein